MFKLIYTNPKVQSIELFGAPFRLTRVDGLGGTESETQMQRVPYQDGMIYLDSLLQDKPIEVEFKITGRDPEEVTEHRRRVSSIFNPKLGMGMLQYVGDGGIKEIGVVVESVPFFPDGRTNRGRTFQKTLIDLRAPYPYWRDPQQVSRSLRAYEGKFTFPFTFPVQFGIEGDKTIINNEGDTSAPVIITIQGPIRRPMVENRTTGEFILVNTSIGPDEVLFIDTSPQAKRVEIHRSNQIIKAMGFFDHNADFWQLQEGENELRYTADEGIAEAIAAISWHSQYVGV
ncbi:phage tail domain-containing protein [Virgibacillus sp. YIM 98842]|uniref:phage tail domain-containing protein n=1 Tax=Virgibacillus sp. YIM 98842 TaxID=2663533 RepID=UPI0013D92888|nr:phage tail domain-containing protein [Virgibacillus sp. YIM 98842]